MSTFSEIEKRHDNWEYIFNHDSGTTLEQFQSLDALSWSASYRIAHQDRDKLIAIIKAAQQEIQDELDTMEYGNDHPENELLLSIVEILEGKS